MSLVFVTHECYLILSKASIFLSIDQCPQLRGSRCLFLDKRLQHTG